MLSVPEQNNVVIVSGMSGSGKSTALDVFEDMGFFCVDGLPVRMAPALVEFFLQSMAKEYSGLALGMDLRQADFAGQWREALKDMEKFSIHPALIFLDASDQTLLRRYATTRRPQPLADVSGLEAALGREREILRPIRAQADLVVDTSDHSVHDLRRVIQKKWRNLTSRNQGMRVHLISFGFKYGIPIDADMVIDVRFLPNPFYVEEYKHWTGRVPEVAAYIEKSPVTKEFKRKLFNFMGFIVDQFRDRGKTQFTIAIGCTGGMHRSVFVTEKLGAHLKEKHAHVNVEHRDLHRNRIVRDADDK